MTRTERATCDHCDQPWTGGAAGGFDADGQPLPTEWWCDDHRPADDWSDFLADDGRDAEPVVDPRTPGADLVHRLRALADVIERLDGEEQLPELYLPLRILVPSDQPEKVRAVVRINSALGHIEHNTWLSTSGTFFDTADRHDDTPSAYTLLDRPVLVPVVGTAS